MTAVMATPRAKALLQHQQKQSLVSPTFESLTKAEQWMAQNKGRGRLPHVCSMGDKCIDARRGEDKEFSMQPMRKSFSVDSYSRKLYLSIQEMILQQRDPCLCPHEVLGAGKEATAEASSLLPAGWPGGHSSPLAGVCEDQRRLGALIVPDKDELILAAEKLSSANSMPSKLTTEKVMRLIRDELTSWTSECSFQIGPILLLDEPFTIDNGLMTPTMKVRRDRIMHRYKDQIARLYKQEL